MKICNIGSINIDRVYSLDRIVTPGETVTSYKFEIFPGGKGLNQSIAAARAGAMVCHGGCVGYDGDGMLQVLSKDGVDTSHVRKVDCENGHAVIQVERTGQNSIVVLPGANERVTKAHIDDILADFDQGDIILLQNEISNVDYVVERAHQKGMCVILNPSPFDQKIQKIDLGKLSYLILNEVEAKEISGTDDPWQALRTIKERYPTLKILLTLGARGCIYADAQTEYEQSAFVVDTVDTTAAGDTFTGYFVAGLAQGMPCAENLRTASAAAALAVSVKGAVPSIPKRQQVLLALEQLVERKGADRGADISRQIDRYLTENIKMASLAELSAQLGYSTAYTGRMVRHFTGRSFSEEIKHRRCKMAADKLLSTDLPIEQIIKEVGYENTSFFRKVFKEKYSLTPMKYRKKRGHLS